jgi:hypothetical protein
MENKSLILRDNARQELIMKNVKNKIQIQMRKLAELNALSAYNNTLNNFPKLKYSRKYLYFIQCGDAVKIGVSSCPEDRMKILSTSSPGKLVLVAKIPNMGHKENEIHKQLAHLKINNEWFWFTPEVNELIKNYQNEG